MAIEYSKWLSSANEVRRHEGNYNVCLEIETRPIAMNEHYFRKQLNELFLRGCIGESCIVVSTISVVRKPVIKL